MFRNKVIDKRQNRYLHQQDKKYSELSKSFCLSPLSILRFETPTQRFLGFLLLMTTMQAAIPSAQAQKTHNDANSFETADKSLQDTINHLDISATPAAYKDNPSSFFQDKIKLTQMISDVVVNRMTECKLRKLAGNKKLKFKLATDEELLSHDTYAQYDFYKQVILVKKDSDLSLDQNKSIMVHEIHHAFIHYTNILKNRNYVKTIDKNTPIPYNIYSLKEEADFAAAIAEGLENIEKYLKLLKAAKKDNSNAKLKILEESLKNYSPMAGVMDVTKEQVENWQARNLLDKDLKFKTPLQVRTKSKFDIPKFLIHIEKLKNNAYEGKLRHVSDPNDSVMAALYDAKAYVLQKYDNSNMLSYLIDAEKDAYTHQIFQLHPQAFQLLFPKLLAIHFNNEDKDYRACLRR